MLVIMDLDKEGSRWASSLPFRRALRCEVSPALALEAGNSRIVVRRLRDRGPRADPSGVSPFVSSVGSKAGWYRRSVWVWIRRVSTAKSITTGRGRGVCHRRCNWGW